MEPSVWRVVPILFGSGFAALVYQTAWQRLLQLTFGASTAASAAVLAIFLGGLGVGGVVFGRRIERSPRPLLFYANLELGIALWTAVTPFLCSGVHHLYLSLGGTATLGTVGATAVRLLLAAFVVGPAAVLMGGTLPAVARAVVTEVDAGRHRLALLYAVNTVGAVFGALIGPLVLFGLLGTRLTLWAAVLVNLLVAVVARAVSRGLPELAVTPAESEARATDSEGAAHKNVVWAYFTAAAAGFGFLTLELVWFRVLSPVLGGSSITFGFILATALLGIGIGGLIFALRPQKHVASIELIATTLAAEAFFVLLPFAWGDDLALVAAHLRSMANLGTGYLVATWIGIAAVVVVPASVVSGYQFPALFALLGQGRAGVGRHVGYAYAFNTAGTLLGSLLTGFLLLPVLGAVTIWRWVAVLFALLGLAGSVVAWRSSARSTRLVLPVLAAAAALLLATAKGPGPLFRHTPVGAGRVDVATLTPNEIISLRRKTEDFTAWERDGVESSVAINIRGGIAFIVNGKSDGSVVSDGDTQAFLGLLPAALHARPKSVFVVGLGTGMTAGLLGRAPGIERVVVAELEPSILEVARRSALANGDILNNRRVQIQFGDGREILLTQRSSYDLIVSEPSNPYRAGIAALFTREFYEAGAARLAPGGLFAQWLQGYEIDARTLAMALRTLSAVFPHVSIWTVGDSDLVLVGSKTPQIVDIERLRRVVEQPYYVDWMRRLWHTEGFEALLAHHIAAPPVTAQLVNRIETEVNTDDVNLLEFAFGWQVGRKGYSAIDDLLGALNVKTRRPKVAGQVDFGRVDEQRHRLEQPGLKGTTPSPRTQATVAGCGGSITDAEKLWPPGTEPADIVEKWVVGSIDAMHGREAALGYAQELEQSGFAVEAALLRSRLAEARSDYEGAVRELLAAFRGLRLRAFPLCDAAVRAFNRAASIAQAHPPSAVELLRAVSSAPLAVYAAEHDRRTTREIIGMRSSDPAVCLEAFAERHGPTTYALPALVGKAKCFEKVGAPGLDAAVLELQGFLDRAPETFRGVEAGTQEGEGKGKGEGGS